MSKDEQGKWEVRESLRIGTNDRWCVDGVANGSPYIDALGKLKYTYCDHPTQAAAQLALDAYLGKEKQVVCSKASECTASCSAKESHKCSGESHCKHVCPDAHCIPIEAEVPYENVQVGRRYRIERAEDIQDGISYCPNGIHTIKELKPSWDRFQAFTSVESPGVRYTAGRYKFYEVNEAETSEKEQEMSIYRTAIITKDPSDGETTTAIGSEQLTIAETKARAITSRTVAEVKKNPNWDETKNEVIAEDTKFQNVG